MLQAIDQAFRHSNGGVLEALRHDLVDLSQFGFPEVGSIIFQDGVSPVLENDRFDLKVPLLCRDGSVVLEIEFEDLVLFLSRWSPSCPDCRTREAISQVVGFLGAHCLPSSVSESGNVIIRDMVPVAVERCATKEHCASMIERMLWSYHIHSCAIGLAYGVYNPLIQEELSQYMGEFFEEKRNVALLLC